MQRYHLLAFALPLLPLSGCVDRSGPDLSHLEAALSTQQLQTLRTEVGLTDAELETLTAAQADRKLRKLSKRTSTSPGNAFLYRQKTMADDKGKVAPDGLIQAIRHRDQMAAQKFGNGGIQTGSWKWLGPGNVGGRIRALWIKPDDPKVIVVGSAGGGIWRSSNAGADWAPVNDYPASLAIGCMASPRDSNTVVWAGTGEGFGNADAIRGAGIYVSSDSGRTFAQMPSTANFNFSFVNRIAFSPTRSATALAATSLGLWRTTDRGASWTRVAFGKYLDVKFHPTDGNRAVAAGDTANQVRFSLDAGANWTRSSGLPVTTTERVELAYAPSSPSIVYASVEIENGTSRVYRSTTNGQSYALRNSTAGILRTQGWYDNAIWVDPTNANTIVVGGVGLYRSTDAGTSFTDITGIHADQHVIMEHPDFNGTSNRIVYVCNDGGLYRADNIYTASRSSGWTHLNNRLGITQFYGGAISANGRPFGGTQDNGTQQLTSESARTYRKIRGSDGMRCAADPVDHRVLFGETQFAGVFRSTDGGVTTPSIVNNLTDSGRGNAPWVGALRLDRNNPNRLWLGSNRLWRTDNAKAASPASVSWRMVRPDVEMYSDVDVAKGNSNLVVAATSTGSIFFSANATLANPTWRKIDTSILPNRFINAVRFNPRNASEIYVCFGGFVPGNVWVTTDVGATWKSASGVGSSALPAAPVRGFAVHPHNAGWLYAGTEVGVFASTDNGKTWSTSNAGPATISVDEIVVRDNGAIYAFTHGRGIYVAHAGTNNDTTAQTTRASLTWIDSEANGTSTSPSISGNGRYVGFASDGTNLVPTDTNGQRDVFLRDRQEGTTERISVDTRDRQSNGRSDLPDVSSTGRFVAFQSTASNLVVNDSNGRSDIFVRDRTMGTTERVSVSVSGAQGNGNSFSPSITGDGRYVVFHSYASNFVPDSNGKADVFRKDRQAGHVTKVSVRGFTTAANGSSFVSRQSVSADGRFIVFHSTATNLVAGDTNGVSDVFLRSYATSFPLTTRISVRSNGDQGDGASSNASISADGRFIVYHSNASNLVDGDINGKSDVFLYDRVSKQTTRMSENGSGDGGNDSSWNGTISEDGNSITFESNASNLVLDTNGERDVFLRTRNPSRIVRVSVDGLSRQSNGNSYWASPSADGRYVTYRSEATNLVNNDTNGRFDVFVFETQGTGNVFPRGVANVAGSLRTGYPLSQRSMLLQQCARETLDRPMVVRRLGFRRDQAATNTVAVARTIDLSLAMGSTDIDTMSSRFQNNWAGSPATVIARKRFHLPDWRVKPSGLAKFDVAFPLDRPYQHTGAKHLLWEARVYDNSRTFEHPTDAHAGNLTLYSNSTVIGRGCDTNTGANFGHTFDVWSSGSSSSYRVAAFRAPRNQPVWLAVGTADPNVQLPGLCGTLHTNAMILGQVGTASSSGSFGQTFPAPAWRPEYRGATLYTQLWTPGTSGGLSYGRRVVLPSKNPGALIKRVFATSTISRIGTLQSLGAVFKLD